MSAPPLWLAWLIGILSIVAIAFQVRWRRHEKRLLAKRANLSRDEFVHSLQKEADVDIVEWLWNELQVYFRPRLTPHPEDDLVVDLPIDHEEPSDWLRDFCRTNGLREKDFSDWPKDRRMTVRNFANWLTVERNRLNQR